MREFIVLGVVLIVVVPCQFVLAAENWPQWRGPSGTGVAADGDYPIEFSSDEGVAWKVELPGLGTSTPAVWGEQIFVTCGIDGKDGIVCYGMDGSERWRKTFGRERAGKHRNGTGSNPSPATDGKHVVVYYKSGTVACLDMDGNVLWQDNLQDRFGVDTLWWDLGTSPVLVDDRVVVAVMHEGPSYLVALDLSTGEVLWKTEREYDNAKESDQSYTTPNVVNLDGRNVIVTWGADHLTGHDASTGELLWECGGFNPANEGMWRVIASSAVGDGIAIVPYGRGKFLRAVRLGGEGDITKSGKLWELSGPGIPSSDVPTPAIKDGKVYVLTDGGRIECLELETGITQWRRDFPKNRNKFYASPVIAGDKAYCVREDGVVFVRQIKEEDKWDLLAENDMGEQIIATPVPVRGGLLIRGSEHLFRIAPE